MSVESQRGFSLVELLVASALFVMFMVSVFTMYAHSHTSYLRGQSRIEVRQSARVTMEALAREIRAAGFDPSSAIDAQATPAAVQEATQLSLTFLADVDGDGTTDRVNYRLQGDRILRSIASWTGSSFGSSTVSELADNIAGLTFLYSDGSAALASPVDAADLSEIRRVTVELIASTQARGERAAYPLTMEIGLRNAAPVVASAATPARRFG